MLVIFLDVTTLVAAILSAIFWFQASRGEMRRVSRSETLNHQDLNRLVVAFNRNQILNRRAALATAVAASLAGARVALDLLS